VYNNNNNDAFEYWRNMEKGVIDGPMFDIGMKGVEGREERERVERERGEREKGN
jgi:hypothetical protein